MTPLIYDTDGNHIYPTSVEMDEENEGNELLNRNGCSINDMDGKPLNLVAENLPFTVLDSSDNPIEVTIYRAG